MAIHSFYFMSVLLYPRTATKTNPSTVRFTVRESDFTSSSRIHFLEHVVVQMSLTLRGYSTRYNYEDFYSYYYNHQGRRDLEDYDDGMFQFEQEESSIEKRDIYDWLGRSHIKRGNIQIELTSPDSTTSVLLPYRNYDFVNEVGYDNWPFMSVHHWGENPVGTWTLKVSFKSSSGSVQLSNLNVKFYGTANTPEAVSSIPSQCDPACAGACSGPGPQNCDVCQQLRVNSTFECVSHCPVGTYQYKKYCLMNESAVHMSATTPKTTPMQRGHATTTPTSAVQAPHTSTHVPVQPIPTSPAFVKPTHITPEITAPTHISPAHNTHIAPEHTPPSHTSPAHTSQVLPNNHQPPHKSRNLHLGPIIGSVLGVMTLLSTVVASIAVGIWCYCKKGRKHEFEFVPMEEPKELNADTA